MCFQCHVDVCGCVSESHPVMGTGCTFGVPLSPDVMEQIFPLIEFLSQPESEYSVTMLRFTPSIPCQFMQHETDVGSTLYSVVSKYGCIYFSSFVRKVLIYEMFTHEDVENRLNDLQCSKTEYSKTECIKFFEKKYKQIF